MKLYAVIDTNVLVSALLRWDSVPGAVLEQALVGSIVPLLKMLHKRVCFGQRNLSGQVCIIDHCILSMEGETCFRRGVANAVKRPHKVQMPGCAAEFSVRDDMVSGFLLLFDKICDAFVFNSLARV